MGPVRRLARRGGVAAKADSLAALRGRLTVLPTQLPLDTARIAYKHTATRRSPQISCGSSQVESSQEWSLSDDETLAAKLWEVTEGRGQCPAIVDD